MAKMLITKEQYNSLTKIGREIHEYWMKWKPKMYREMAQAGTLWETLKHEDERLDEMACDLITVKGLSENMAMEIVRAEIYDEMAD
jgi:hypothetical protein